MTTLGLLDIPSDFFTLIDTTLLNPLLPLYRLIIWAFIAAFISMLLYKLMSAQNKLEAIKVEVGKARQAMSEYDGEADGLPPLIFHSLKLSFSQIGITLGPAIFSSLPALCLIIWISNTYGYKMPMAGDWIELSITPKNSVVLVIPSEFSKKENNKLQIQWPENEGVVTLIDSSNHSLLSFPLTSAVPIIHKESWWNNLMGNPLGYLPAESSVEFIELNLQPQRLISFGPTWLGYWETIFFSFIIIISLAIKFIFKIH